MTRLMLDGGRGGGEGAKPRKENRRETWCPGAGGVAQGCRLRRGQGGARLPLLGLLSLGAPAPARTKRVPPALPNTRVVLPSSASLAAGGRKRPLMPNLAELLEEEEEEGAGGGSDGSGPSRKSDGGALLPAARQSDVGGLPAASPPHKYPRTATTEGEEGGDGEGGAPPPRRPSSVAETDVEALQARVKELQTQVGCWVLGGSRAQGQLWRACRSRCAKRTPAQHPIHPAAPHASPAARQNGLMLRELDHMSELAARQEQQLK